MLRAGSLVVLLFVVVRADVTYADISAQLLNLRATKLSVDHAGNLWAWNKMTNVVTRFTTAGTVVESAELPKSDNVDADTDFGIATLSHFGRSLDVFDWTGHVRFHVPVAESACDLAWIDADHIAISSSYADHRLEIWRLSSREMTRSIGACNGVSRMPGVNPAHATLIKYDQERKEILTLDAFSGEFQVFSREGTLLRHASVENPHRAEIAKTLVEADRVKKAAGNVVMPLIFSFPMFTTTSDGAVWLSANRDDRGNVDAVKIERDGSVKPVRLFSPDCPSSRFVAWQGYFIFFRDPSSSPQTICTAVRRQK